MDFFELIDFLVLSNRIVIKREKMIYLFGDERMISRDIQKEIIIIAFDNRRVFFISEDSISFGA